VLVRLHVVSHVAGPGLHDLPAQPRLAQELVGGRAFVVDHLVEVARELGRGSALHRALADEQQVVDADVSGRSSSALTSPYTLGSLNPDTGTAANPRPWAACYRYVNELASDDTKMESPFWDRLTRGPRPQASVPVRRTPLFVP
jgi:hypothetical protein